jgi:hypothetical protein
MAYFAELDNTNTVIRVISVSNDVCGEPTLDFPDTCAAGRAFIANTLKLEGVWKQTSYNTYRDYAYTLDDSTPPQVISVEYLGSKHRTGGTPYRGQYAGVGDFYDADLDEFVTPVVEDAPE